jgi:hypothetical protein
MSRKDSPPLFSFQRCDGAAKMTRTEYSPLNSRKRTILYYAVSLCCVIGLMAFASSLHTTPVEETITVDSNQTNPQPHAPVVNAGELPPADPDIETAGDKVAAAYIYLKRRQSEPALNALQQAQLAANRAVVKKPDGSKIKDELLATNQEIERVKELIRKGRIGYAARELKHVDQTLDSVSY